MEWNPLSTPGHLISRAARAFSRIGEPRLRPFGFGVGHLPALVALKDGAALSQRDLARFARIEQSSMAQMLARMERDGVIQRTPDPADGRSSLISLTDRARAGLPGARAALLQVNEEALAGFTGEEAATLASLLGRVIENLDRVEAGSLAALPALNPPACPVPRRVATGRRRRR